MANFSPKKLEAQNINSGVPFSNGDALRPSDINAIVDGVLYAQKNGGSGLPSFSPSDAGKFLVIDENGQVVAQTITIGGSY
jgi:hypothetical protein